VKVSRVPERDWQIDLPDGERFHSGDDPVERLLTVNFRQPRVLVIHWFQL
jgi:hypothetical protein